MSEAMHTALRRVLSLAVAVMLVATLSAIAVVRADNRNERNQVAAGAGTQTPLDLGAADGSNAPSSDLGLAEPAPGGATAPTPRAATPSAGGATRAPARGTGTNGAAAASSGPIRPSTGTNCPDYNPSIGVYCDHFLMGGTTVLSGPLAVYGDQGLKAGLAWIAYYNSVIAPRENLRKAKLVWYDDNLDPNKTLQFVQRLNEVDKVLYLGGITSPEAASKYLETTKFPMIGDIGLSPKSYTNRYIFPTAPSEIVRNPLRIKIAKNRFNPKSFAVIQDVLPSVDTTPFKKAWEQGARDYGVEQVEYVEIASTASDCSGQFSKVIQKKPEYIVMPTAAGVLLACLREARKFSVQPGSPNSQWLKGWTGGSNLQVEVDNCRPTCEGMLSIGTIFSDPRVSQTPEMKTYVTNMARYAPNVDITGFIAINYYHTGWVFYNMVKQAGIQNALTRENLVNAAEHFGPFDTGFGNTIQWTTNVPREPWHCGYPVVVTGERWTFESTKTCL